VNTAAESPGCVIVLIDESSAMQAPMQVSSQAAKMGVTGPKKTRSESVATALNAMLNQLSDGSNFEIALVGYRSEEDAAKVSSRWAGSLEGRDFVQTSELADSPVRIEERTRQRRGGRPGAEASVVQFPVWYEPDAGGKSMQLAAFEYCADLLEKWLANAGPNPAPPVVCHLTTSSSADGNPSMVVKKIQEMELPTGSPAVFNVFLSSYAEITPNIFPSNRAFLPPGAARAYYDRSSMLDDASIEHMRSEKVPVNDRARGLVFNAKMLELVTFLNLVRMQTNNWASLTTSVADGSEDPVDSGVVEPVEGDVEQVATASDESDDPGEVQLEGAAETQDSQSDEELDSPEVSSSDVSPASSDQPLAVLFVIDRSVEDPYSSQLDNCCERLCAEANELLGGIAKEGSDAIEVAVVSYGGNEDEPTVEQAFVNATDLASTALREEEYIEMMDNGAGGLFEVPKKKLIFVELEPAEQAPASDAFETATGLLTEWCGEHAGAPGPIVLHMTRGGMDGEDIKEAAAKLQQIDSAILYHAVKADGHPSVYYPANDEALETDGLKALYSVTSALLGSARLSEENSSIHSESQGIVINGKFDQLLAAVGTEYAT